MLYPDVLSVRIHLSSPILMYFVLALVHQEPTREGELKSTVSEELNQICGKTHDSCIDSRPSKQDAKIKSNA